MWGKALAFVLCAVGLGVGTGCNRAGEGQPGSPDRRGPGDVAEPDGGPALDDADAYAARAYDWLCKGQYDRALKDYDRAIRLRPDHPAFLNARGFAWHMKGIQDRDRPACEDR